MAIIVAHPTECPIFCALAYMSPILTQYLGMLDVDVMVELIRHSPCPDPLAKHTIQILLSWYDGFSDTQPFIYDKP
jgi:hypothetical protein